MQSEGVENIPSIDPASKQPTPAKTGTESYKHLITLSVIVVVVLLLVVSHEYNGQAIKIIFSFVGASIIASAMGVYFDLKTRKTPALLRALNIGLDSVVIFSLIYFSGGLESDIIFMLVLPIIVGWYHLENERIVFHTASTLLFLSFLALPFVTDPIALSNFFIPTVVFVLVSGVISLSGIRLIRANIDNLKNLAESKDEFMAIASHEMNTPLSIIKGNLDMLVKDDAGKIPAKAKEYLNDSILGVSRLLHLIRDMLSVSKFQAGQADFQEIAFDLAELSSRVLKDFEILASEKTIQLVHNHDGSKLMVIGDEQKVEEILVNLIGNALKFTPKGSVTISHRHSGKYIFTDVRDTGIGIDKQDMSRLFKKFSQTKTNLSEFHKGTGLGLYISKVYVEGMGGQIHAQSEPGEGTVFSFSLPLSSIKNQ